MTIAIIDGDIVGYRIAAANEARSINVRHIPSGREKVFKHRTEMKQSIDLDKFPIEQFEITDVQTPEDVSHALHTVKTTIKGILETLDTDLYEIYISGKGNFRETLPLPQKYKGNRTEMLRPLLLNEVRQYLINKYNATVVDGKEADDMLSIRQYDHLKGDEKTIAYTRDKDAFGADGWLYVPDVMDNPTLISGLGELYINDKGKVKGYGFKWKALQWVLGDISDAYKPTYLCGKKFGEKAAYSLLGPLKTERDVITAVRDTYKVWYPDKVEYTDQTGNMIVADYVDLAQVYFSACHMWRWESDYVDVRAMFEELKYEY